MGDLFLTGAQQNSLRSYVDKWETAVESRDTILENEMNMEEENLSASQLDDPNPYFSDDDEEVHCFSVETSKRSEIYRSLYQWVNHAFRSVKILHQAISKGTRIAPEKLTSLLKELKPPNKPEAANIPHLQKAQLSDDEAVQQYVTALKKHRFLWKKQLSTQKRQLKAGFGSLFSTPSLYR